MENNAIEENSKCKFQEALTNSRLGIDVPAKKAWTSVSASFGLCKGTSWPAPLTLTNVRPAYSWVHPPTCFIYIT